MQNNRLGCFSPSAIVTALLTLAVIAGIMLSRGNGMFSPGALNAQTGSIVGGVSSHAEIGGKCRLCHTAPWDSATMAERCADCHSDIVADMSKIAKAHGAMLHKDPNLTCRHCHPEHRGATVSLTLDSARVDFPHDVMGYPLSGHALTVANEPFACEDCHPQSVKQFDQATCVDCHLKIDKAFTQAHSVSWGKDCLACHDGVDTYNKHFDHGKVPFALLGAHVNVDCYTCHTQARSLVDLQSLPRDCFSCHQKDEPHAGRFGSDCAECHTMNAWKPATFDHNLAAFKLEGKHIEVACEDCHPVDPQQVMSTECFACHAKDDKHKGAFGEKCDLCHKATGWNDDPFDHNKSKFPLIGGHLGVACETCHKDGNFTNMSTSCFDCHGFPGWHGSAFGANCADCHTVDNWNRVTQGINHTWWKHPDGEVGMGNCKSCHPSTVYQSDCSSCHGKGGPGGD
jgi:hypothetical protein